MFRTCLLLCSSEFFVFCLLSENIKCADLHMQNMILSFVLYGCETCCLILVEGHRLRVIMCTRLLADWVLRRLYGLVSDEVTGGWRSHNEEL